MLEQQLQSKIIKYLESKGCWTTKVITSNKRGTCDILACLPNGRFCGIEVKAKGKLNTVTPIQQFQIDRINEAGGIAIAADSLETVKKVFDNV